MILRAKTKNLFSGKELTLKQQENSDHNIKELEAGKTVLESYPRRLVFELTNACNLNCIMCGRNAADFKPTVFDMDIFRSFEPLMDTIEEVTLMGWGEPTIHPNFIEMLEIINKHSARKYFCTNGMNLKKIKNAIFDYNVDVFAVSLDGATDETNSRIRRGSKIDVITEDLKEIVRIKKERGLKYLTVFGEDLMNESLWGHEDQIRSVFEEAAALGEASGIILKLPHIPGEDIAGENLHKECFVAWRDFFLGSDGYVRPCMSTPIRFFQYDKNKSFMDIWNAPEYQKYRTNVNNANDMDDPCRRCYQSSHCNWNKKESFIQIGEQFSPEWD